MGTKRAKNDPSEGDGKENESENDKGNENKQKEETKAVIKSLLDAVEKPESGDSESDLPCTTLIQLFFQTSQGQNRSPKQQQAKLLSTVQSMGKSSSKRFFTGLQTLMEPILTQELYIPESAMVTQDDDEEEYAPPQEITPDEKSTKCLKFLKCVSLCVQANLQGRLDHRKDRRQSMGMQLQVLPQVYEVACSLHNILLAVHDCGPDSVDTKNSIIALCEKWWLANAMHRDTLIAQCLPLLVLQFLEGKDFQKVQIKRLYKLKDAFHVIDFSNPCSESLRTLLLRMSSNPLCLRMPEGKKFLAAICQDQHLLQDLHMAFRAQIPAAKKSILQAYGEIYHRAWKDASESEDEEVCENIEHLALQDLMQAAIHVASDSTVKSILVVLEPIHAEKKAKRTAELLYRLYSPILWRSLAAANPLVRKNALTILEKVFPLHDPSQNQMMASVSKGVDALKSAMKDVDPRVRVAGSLAAARVCATFWDALPAAQIRILLNHIVMDHASDKSSSAVRAASLEAATVILGTQQSHAVLRPLLPSLGNLIHDKAERVRMAAVKMLIRIKRTSGIRFYHVVPVDHIASRMVEEKRLHGNNPTNAVARELTALMLNSYFPQGPGISGANQVQRALTFLVTDPEAATVFYSNLSSHLNLEAVAKFIVMLVACLKAAVHTEKASRAPPARSRNKRQRTQDENDNPSTDNGDKSSLSSANIPLMVALAETICALIESISKDMENEAVERLILQRMADADLVNIISHFEQKGIVAMSQDDDEESAKSCHRVCSAILRSVSALPRDSIDGLASLIAASLESFASQEDAPISVILAHLAVLTGWGRIDAVGSSLAQSIEAALRDGDTMMSPCVDGDNKVRNRKQSGRKKSVDQIVLPVFRPMTIRDLLDNILAGSEPTSLSLRGAILSSAVACDELESALQNGVVFAERLLASDPVSINDVYLPVRALENYTCVMANSDALCVQDLGKAFKQREVELIISSCEAYGRLSLHREAQKNDGIGMGMCAKQLLEWTTNKVVPALLGSQQGETELRDLDLSHISNVSDSLIIPPSPLVDQHGNSMPRTPADEFGAGISFFGRESGINDPAPFLISAVARSLLQSSCLIFAEILAVGGSSCGGEISAAAVQWCKIFEDQNEDDVDSAKEEDIRQIEQRELLPSFVRLAAQLSRTPCNNVLLLERLCVTCSEKTLGDDCGRIKKAVQSLLNNGNKTGSTITANFVDRILSSLDDLAPTSENKEEVPEEIDSARDIWSHRRGCLALVLDSIVSNQRATRYLAAQLAQRLKQVNSGSEDSESGDINTETKANGNEEEQTRRFHMRCLILLLSKNKTAARCGLAGILDGTILLNTHDHNDDNDAATEALRVRLSGLCNV